MVREASGGRSSRRSRALRFRHRLEYLGLKLIFLLVDHLPFALTYRGVPILADLWYRVSLARRRTAVENILRAGVVKDRRAAGRLARRSFCHMLWLALETLSTARFSDESDWHRRIRATISPETLAALERADQGIIMVSGHLGNWEIAVQLLSFYKPVYGITRNMNNPLTDRLIHDRKSRPRFILLPKHDLNTARFFQVLKQGNILAMMIDQYARARGMMVDFFGIPASTHTSHALLHLVTGAPVVVGYCIRTGPMQFELVAETLPPHRPTGDRQADTRAILEALNRKLEDAIRAYPEQYVWVHRRWRHQERLEA